MGQVAHKIKGSAGPTGCDSNHWQDVLFHFGSHSRRLRDAVAELICLFANSIIDFPLIRTLMANPLIALDKSPGV